jgi:hypothetical protein
MLVVNWGKKGAGKKHPNEYQSNYLNYNFLPENDG